MDGMVERIRRYLDAQEETRERVLDASRRVIRNSARAMAALHREDRETVEKTLEEAREGIKVLAGAVEEEPRLEDYGPVLAAYREFAEVKIVRMLIEGQELSDPRKLGIPYKPYLTALGDAMGEFRRHVLDLIRTDKIVEAERMLGRMEDIFAMLMEFDYPGSILPELRRKRDVARRVLEQTRGDITTAVRQRKLEEALRRTERKLEG